MQARERLFRQGKEKGGDAYSLGEDTKVEAEIGELSSGAYS
jgi:hypothetical protein